jgi:predicted nucleic acid-binding protein
LILVDANLLLYTYHPRAEQHESSRRMDAVLAALAIEHGATLCTTDRDFARFPALKWTNPIAATRS